MNLRKKLSMKTMALLIASGLITAHGVGYLVKGPVGMLLVFGSMCLAGLIIGIFWACREEAEMFIGK